MSIKLEQLVKKIVPEETILFFGSGATVESNAPSVEKIISDLGRDFQIDPEGYTLGEITAIIEEDYSRRELIDKLKDYLSRTQPIGGIKNLPLYSWKTLYTTNYDNVVEESYRQKNKELNVYASNHDFSTRSIPQVTKYYKLHGTIEKNVAYGDSSRIVLTDFDYDEIEEYREALITKLKADLIDSHLIIIGYSLNDEHIKKITNEAVKRGKSTGSSKVTLLIYSEDENRAKIWERRGFEVCFGGISEFFNKMDASNYGMPLEKLERDNTFDTVTSLTPTTKIISEELVKSSNINMMVNGSPASYSDIKSNLTFKRDIFNDIKNSITNIEFLSYTILGPSGVGKTTLARQLLFSLNEDGFKCFEHRADYDFNFYDWIEYAKKLIENDEKAVLLIDDAHSSLNEVMKLIEYLDQGSIKVISILLTSSKDRWTFRTKNPSYFKNNMNYDIKLLSNSEIDSLINVVENHDSIRKVINSNFDGFTRSEIKRRLKVQCESETFVCLKNIYATEKFDDIILREYASLSDEIQEIYRLVSALEYCGVRVHRQLVTRLLGIEGKVISHYLDSLIDIVYEYNIDSKEGIYGWKGRHPVITKIIIDYKFHDKSELFDLIERVVDNIIPAYDIEVKSLKELCNFETGIPSLKSKIEQNRLLRKIISMVPSERIPRHRLIRNLVEIDDFENSEAEIKVYENDFGGKDPTLYRYKTKLKVERALKTKGIMDEDRNAILYKAVDELIIYISDFPNNRFLLKEMCGLGVTIAQRTGNVEWLEQGLSLLKNAEIITQDPEVTSYVSKFESKLEKL